MMKHTLNLALTSILVLIFTLTSLTSHAQCPATVSGNQYSWQFTYDTIVNCPTVSTVTIDGVGMNSLACWISGQSHTAFQANPSSPVPLPFTAIVNSNTCEYGTNGQLISYLPVKLMSFEIEMGTKTKLKWKSASEHNFKVYEIERGESNGQDVSWTK